MPPKKRDRDNDTSKNSKIDHLQADHELFLQAFEKPTQIYRFLRTRNMLSPIFLNRTVSYMKRRMSRSNKSRIGFKVDSLLEKVTLRRSTELQPNSLGGYMTLTFLGFYDKSLEHPRDYLVKVETLLLKICHKKRKESSSAIIEVSVGSCSVPLNPSSSEPPAMASAVSISSDTFSPSQGPNVKSYMLMLRVTVTMASSSNGNGLPSSSTSELTNGHDNEPATKRLKPSDSHLPPTSTETKWSRLYGSELIVYDKHNRCLLTNGEYDLVLHDTTLNSRSGTIHKSPHKALMAQWETIPHENEKQTENPFDVFKVRPLLKLKLSWSQEPTNGLVNRPKLFQQGAESNGGKKEPSSKERPSGSTHKTNILDREKNGNGDTKKCDNDDKRQQIIYQFLYNNNSRQQTEACDDLHCPWCSLDCGALYALLKHLKLCHSRFNFTYIPLPAGARIDVSINELYDGSYTGSPHDLIASQGRSAACGPRAGPTRRTELTHVLAWRPRRRRAVAQRQSLAEFLELDDSEAVEAQRPYITGHNRLYHHTITCLPVYPNELDIDSESETDPLWLQQKTMMMIDEFTDVNEGEKELMKMWNLHVMKNSYVGDLQIPLACQMFLQMKGKELLEKNLYRNFILHVSSLHDFGLLSPVALYQTVQKLNQLLADSPEAKERMRASLRAQREHWNAVVTVSKKTSPVDNQPLCSGQKSFISIHSTDHLCQLADIETSDLDECNVEILSLNEVFPSNSDESLSNDEAPVRRRKNLNRMQKAENLKALYVPSNSKSSTVSSRQKEVEAQPSGYSTVDIPKNTLYVIGSNPGEPKMSYQDPPKKISKTMKKFLRNIDKHKNEQSKGEKAISKLTTMRGILKDSRCGPECTGDSVQGEDYNTEDLTLPFPMDFGPHSNYTKQNPDKNVTFNTQVVIIHFSGDLCVGQSVETLSKEKDQQARNSELRKTFLTKYNEFWPTQK